MVKLSGGNTLMGYRVTESKCFVLCILLTFIMGCYLATLPITSDKEALPRPVKYEISHLPQNISSKKRLAIIVPFRDRFVQLLSFVPHMHKFLNKQQIPFHIFVVQQKDGNRFNRASLINAGFLYVKSSFDYIAMHDVDLLPLNDDLKYDYPEEAPHHVSGPEIHPHYHYKKFIGGILLIKNEHFELVNGMSNVYWGWGLEDDEFYVRLQEVGLSVTRPQGLSTGTENTFKHNHDKTVHRRDYRKCYNQREVTRYRDRATGLFTLAHQVTETYNLTIDGNPLTVINVELQCDHSKTPWCVCPEPVKPKKETKSPKAQHSLR